MWTAPALAQPTLVFRQPALYSVYSGGPYYLRPYGIAIADLNGDNWPDVVVANRDLNPQAYQGDNSIVIFKNTGNWLGNPPTSGLTRHIVLLVDASDPQCSGANCRPTEVALADMDNDGWRDIVFTFAGRTSFGIFWNNFSATPGSFDPTPRLFYVGDQDFAGPVIALLVRDLSNDSTQDVLVGCDENHQPPAHFVKRLLGPAPHAWRTGNPSLVSIDLNVTPEDYILSSYDAASGIFRPGGPVDLTTVDGYGARLSVLWNDGAEGFSPANITNYEAPKSLGVTANRLRNALSVDDLALSAKSADQVHVYWNDGAGSFLINAYYDTGAFAAGLSAAVWTRDRTWTW